MFPLRGLELKSATHRSQLAIGGIGVEPGVEVGRSLKLRSGGTAVGLESDHFHDPDHLRLLFEDIHIAAAGGKPDRAAAFLADGFQ